MPSIPEFSQRVGLPQSSGLNPQASGLGVVGEAVSSAGKDFTQAIQQKERRDAAAYVTSSSADLQLRQTQRNIQSQEDARKSGSVDGYTANVLKAYDQDTQDLIKKAPNQLAKDDLISRASSYKNSLLESSMRFESGTRVEQYKLGLNTAAGNYAKTALLDPTQTEIMFRQIDGDAEGAKATLGVDAEEFRQKAKASVAMAAVQGQIDTSPDNAESLLSKYKDQLSADNIMRLQDGISNERDRRQREAEAAQRKAEARQRELQMLYFKDPSAYVQETEGITDPSRLADRQRQLGVPDNSIRILNEQQAQGLSQQLQALDTPQKYTTVINSLQQKYGDTYPIVLRDLVRGGLPDSGKLMAYMDPNKDVDVVKANFEIMKLGNEGKDVKSLAADKIKRDGGSPGDIEAAVAENLSDYVESSANGGMPLNQIKFLKDNTEQLANYFYANGATAENAAVQATRWLTDRYSFGDINGRKFHVPADQYQVDDIENFASDTLKNLKDEEIGVFDPNLERAPYIEQLRSEGTFVSVGNDRIRLVDNLGRPVVRKNGTFYELKFDDIVKEQKAKEEQKADPADLRNISGVMGR
jgi:hypothetical protein